MNEGMVQIYVQVRREKGQEDYELHIPYSKPLLQDAFSLVASLEWGEEIIEQVDEGLRARAGVLVVLNNRMIPAWNVDTTEIRNGDKLRFVPVVAGG
jgi:sulfur carrier protein ThiS